MQTSRLSPVPIRTVGDQTYRLRDLTIRFVDSGTVRQADAGELDRLTLAAVEGAAAGAGVGPAGRPSRRGGAPDLSPPDPLAALRAGAPLDALPWYTAFAALVTGPVSFARPGFGGGVDAPVARVCCAACLVPGASSPPSSPSLVEALRSLAAAPPSPSPAAAGAAAGGAPELVHYLLLLDARRAGREAGAAAQAALAAAQAALGGSGRVSLLTLFAAAAPPDGTGPPTWGPALHAPTTTPSGGAGEVGAARQPPPPGPGAGGVVGGGLSAADAAALAAWVGGWAAASLVPALEARIRALHALAAAGRKGLRSQLLKAFNFNRKAAAAAAAPASGGGGGGGGGGASSSGAATTPTAAVDASSSASDAATLARLADLCLALRDFDTAAWAARAAGADAREARDGAGGADAAEVLGLALAASAAAPPPPGGPPPSPAALAAAMDPAIAALRDAVARRTALAGGGGANADGTGGAATAAGGLPAARQGATRAAVLLAAVASATGRWADAHWGLMKAHFGEEPLPAAVLLEQAALCLLRLGGGGASAGALPSSSSSSSPAIRKWAFHTVLAGLRYAAGGASGLGAAAYGAAAPVYEGKGWCLIEEHVGEVLGRSAAAAGAFGVAADAFGRLLPAVHAPAAWQGHYLRAWADAAGAAAGAAPPGTPPPPAPVPFVSVDRVTFHAEGGETVGGPDAAAAPPGAWRRLDWALGPGAAPSAPTLSYSSSPPATTAAAAARRCCVAGEAVAVEVPFSNPMAIPLALEGLCLVVEAVPGGGEEGGVGKGKQPAQQPAEVAVAARDVTLAPGEAATLRLVATPATPGAFAITGVEWRLAGVAARARFGVRGRGGERKENGAPPPRAPSPAPAHFFCFEALPPAPRLAADVIGLPPTLLAGELAPATLVLTNVGPAPAGGVVLGISCPDALLVVGGSASPPPPLPTPPGVRAPPVSFPLTRRPLPRPPGLEAGDTAGAAAAEGAAATAGLAAFEAAPGATLLPGQSAAWRVWVHPPPGRGGGRGGLDLKVVVSYAAAASAGAASSPGAALLSRRVLRARAVVDVVPGVTARCAPAPLSAGGGAAHAAHAGATTSTSTSASARRWAVRLDAAADGSLPPPGATLDRLAVWGRGWRVGLPGGGGGGGGGSGSGRTAGASPDQGGGGMAAPVATPLPPGGAATLFFTARAPAPVGRGMPPAASTPDLSGAFQRALSLEGEDAGSGGEGGGAAGGPPRPSPVDADTADPATAAAAAASAACAVPGDADAALAAFHARRRATAAARRAGRAAAAAAAARPPKRGGGGGGGGGGKAPPPPPPPALLPPPPPSAILEWSVPPGPGAGPSAPRRRGACHLLAAGPPLFGFGGGAEAAEALSAPAPLCSATADVRLGGGDEGTVGPPLVAVTVAAVNRTGGAAVLRVRAGAKAPAAAGGAAPPPAVNGGGWAWTPAPPASTAAVPLGPPPAPGHAWVGATVASSPPIPPGGEGMVGGLAVALLSAPGAGGGGGGGARGGGLDLGAELEVAWVPVLGGGGRGAVVVCAPPRLQVLM